MQGRTKTDSEELLKYRTQTRVLHWVHSAAFVLLFFTGLVLFVPPLGFLAEDGYTRLIHRIAAVLFVVAPLVYIPLNWKSSLQGMKKAFRWGVDDIGWLRTAPGYYFLGHETGMPPQDDMNTGQKMWWLLVIIFGVVFVISGLIMWVFKTAAPSLLLQWAVFAHDVSFIVTGAMFFVHIYLGVLHPLMRSKTQKTAWDAMISGRVSAEYARSHHGKWYQEMQRRG